MQMGFGTRGQYVLLGDCLIGKEMGIGEGGMRERVRGHVEQFADIHPHKRHIHYKQS